MNIENYENCIAIYGRCVYLQPVEVATQIYMAIKQYVSHKRACVSKSALYWL